ncbi:hypothetical protein BDZ91DRAFT_697039 [Kalaharituber pfeilii]|nr:hypothetical protein BDZ91DRAFT_697039 [Kalaharituber pfeilii]
MPSSPGITRQWVLARRSEPNEDPSKTFELEETVLYNSMLEPEYGPNSWAAKKKVAIKVHWLSNDPSQRTWIGRQASYIVMNPGDVMRAWGVGQVIESYKDEFKRGDWVYGMMSWSEYIIYDDPATTYPPGLQKLTEEQAKDPASYIAARLTGLTAYYGLLHAGCATSSDQTIIISTAAGATGAFAVQIAKNILKIPNIIGITGSDEKLPIIRDLGCTVALNYKSPDFEKKLIAATPRLVDLYYDNVGGEMLDMCMRRIRRKGRVVACGSVSSYAGEGTAKESYPKEWRLIITQGLTVQGFLVSDYLDDFEKGIPELMGWIEQGKIKVLTTVFETPFDRIPEGLSRLLDGKNVGKLVTKIKY